METIVAVWKELWYFVFVEHFGFSKQDSLQIKAPTASVMLPSAKIATIVKEDEEVKVGKNKQFAKNITAGEPVYVAVPDTVLCMYPTCSIDSVLDRLPYSFKVTYRQSKGAWSEVSTQDNIGWVRSDVLVLDESDVLPQLKAGVAYSSFDTETIKLRSIIKDEFSTVATELPLQDIEYVSYKLSESSRIIPWPDIRPRIAGTWKQLLRGRPGVHIGVHPKTDSIIERINEDGTGMVGYVEAVLPDLSVTVSYIDTAKSGIFCVETLEESVWREWRPVFIEIT